VIVECGVVAKVHHKYLHYYGASQYALFHIETVLLTALKVENRANPHGRYKVKNPSFFT